MRAFLGTTAPAVDDLNAQKRLLRLCDARRFRMELVFKNRWIGNRSLINRLDSVQRDIDDAAGGLIVPGADFLEGAFTYNQVPAIKTCLRYSVEPDQTGLRCDGHAFSPRGLDRQ
jgi:hypothetical protein